MAQPRQAERRPSEVTIPQLSREETERRAGRAFDSAIVGLLGQYFRGPPPASEMTAFRRMADEAVRSAPRGQTVDIGGVVDRFIREHPDSVIARYTSFTGGSTDWLMNADTGRIQFSQSALTHGVTEFFASAKTQTVAALARLSDPRNRGMPVDFSSVDLVLERRRIPPSRQGEQERIVETTAGQVLIAALSAQISHGSNQLPATATYQQQDSNVQLASLLPPPETHYGPSDFQKKRG
jgi:hypothetical protein